MVKYRYAVTIHIDGTDSGTVDEIKAEMPVLTDRITKLMLEAAAVAGTDATIKVTQICGDAYEVGD